MRAKGRFVDTDEWREYGARSGQQLFHPPNVAGWNDARWLDSGTWLARWQIADRVLQPFRLATAAGPATPQDVMGRALVFWNRPRLSRSTRKVLLQFASASLADVQGNPVHESYVENVLRQLIATSPEFQVA
jgi:hypothetical protein